MIRTCRICGITSDLIRFYVRKRKRKHGISICHENICIACKREETSFACRKHWRKNRIRRYSLNYKWRVKNRKKYNLSQRIAYRKKVIRSKTNLEMYYNCNREIKKGGLYVLVH